MCNTRVATYLWQMTSCFMHVQGFSCWITINGCWYYSMDQKVFCLCVYTVYPCVCACTLYASFSHCSPVWCYSQVAMMWCLLTQMSPVFLSAPTPPYMHVFVSVCVCEPSHPCEHRAVAWLLPKGALMVFATTPYLQPRVCRCVCVCKTAIFRDVVDQ